MNNNLGIFFRKTNSILKIKKIWTQFDPNKKTNVFSLRIFNYFVFKHIFLKLNKVR